MQYQTLLKRIVTLISSPAKAWEEIVHQDVRSVFMDFVYPMIGLCGLSALIGALFNYGWSGPESFQKAMMDCCAVAVSLFGGYFMAAFFMNEVGVHFLHMQNRLALSRHFVGYAMVVYLLVQLVVGILPNLKGIGLVCQVYMVYVIWEGAPIVMKVKDNKRLSYTLICAALVYGCPTVIRIVFDYLSGNYI